MLVNPWKLETGAAAAALLATFFTATFLACTSQTTPTIRDGDIIFQTSRSNQSVAIQRATHSPYSHMGIVLYRDGAPFVLEAVGPVKYTPLDQWTARGVGSHFVVKRLRNADKRLGPEVVKKLQAAANELDGKAYDLAFEWSDERIYCSELVWKLYDRALGVEIGHLQALRTFDLSDPAVKQKLAERYGSEIPLDEPVISPAAMFDSDELELVIKQ